MAAESAVVFDKVSRRFGSVTAVDAISLEIAPGELVSLLGPSGCGKTTTLRLLAGLEMPSSGRILIGGRDVSRIPASGRDIGMVFQSYALFPHLKVFDNVAYGLIARGERKHAAHARAREQLEQLGLGVCADRLPSELSGGQQQRVAVARALVMNPDVLLFDEPLSNLDATLRRQVRDDIKALQRRLGLTVIYVTHDQSEALAISDRIIIMQAGRIAQSGSPRTLYEHPATGFVADFMGDANVIAGEVSDSGKGPEFALAGLSFPADGFTPGDAAELIIRPQHMRFAQAGDADSVAGRIEHVSYLGSIVEYRIAVPFATLLFVDTAPARMHEAGDCVVVALQRQAIRVVRPAVQVARR